MANNFDLYNLYKQVFNKPFSIPEATGQSGALELYDVPANERERGSIKYSQKGIPFNKVSALGRDIWFPVTFWISNDKFIDIDACTIGVVMSKVIVKTAVSEQKGTVKEQFDIDDTQFNVRGFLIGKDRNFPEDQVLFLTELFESQKEIYMTGGYPELFLGEEARVVIKGLEFPEVQGRMPNIRPFFMKVESDFVKTLTLD
jgi:hypothetical protein